MMTKTKIDRTLLDGASRIHFHLLSGNIGSHFIIEYGTGKPAEFFSAHRTQAAGESIIQRHGEIMCVIAKAAQNPENLRPEAFSDSAAMRLEKRFLPMIFEPIVSRIGEIIRNADEYPEFYETCGSGIFCEMPRDLTIEIPSGKESSHIYIHGGRHFPEMNWLSRTLSRIEEATELPWNHPAVASALAHVHIWTSRAGSGAEASELQKIQIFRPSKYVATIGMHYNGIFYGIESDGHCHT